MADEEPKIPVFSVLKNGVILKNIFVVSNPSAVDDTDCASEVILNVGRHHDCHILLNHPSISRFHLRIFSNPSSQKLSVMDLSSVHGTWVNYTKIEPGIRVELNEGDTLCVGSSSRVHKLHWVPLNQAYDTKCSFMSSLVEEKEEETSEIREEVSAQDDQVEKEDYVEKKSIREEISRYALPIDEDKDGTAKVEGETVEAYWDDLLKIDYGEYGGYKCPLEDIDQAILANGEGEVMETAKTGEIVSENQAHDIVFSYLSALDPSLVEEKDEKASDNRGLSVQDDKVELGEYEYRDTLKEIGRDIVAIDEEKEETAKVEGETKEAYWDDLLKIEYGEYGGYKCPLEDIDQAILASGEGEVMETAKTGEIVSENQVHDIVFSYLSALDPSSVEGKEEKAVDNRGLSVQDDKNDLLKVELGEYEYRDILEEIGRDIVAIDEDKEETAKVEGETMEAYWDDLLKIDCGEFGEYKYPLEDMVGESEVMETANVGVIVAADQIVKGESGEYKDQLEQSNEHIPAGGEDATEASQVGDLLHTANNEELNEESNQGMLESDSEVASLDMTMLESDSEVASLDMTFEGLGSPALSESCGLLVREETPMRLPVPQRMDSSSSDDDITRISEETNLKGGENCIACSEFVFSEWMTFSLPPEILLETILLKSDKEETLGVGIATESAFDAIDDNLIPQNEDSGNSSPDENNGEFDSESYEAANNSNECSLLESSPLPLPEFVAANSSNECSLLESSPSLLPEVVAATKCQIPGAENPMPPVPCSASETELIPEIDNPRDSKTKEKADILESIDAPVDDHGNHSATFRVDEERERQNMKVEENDEELSIHLEDPAADLCLLNDENQTVVFSFSRRHIPFAESSTPRLWSSIGKLATGIQLQTDKRSRKSRSTVFNAENRHQIRENAENVFVVRDLSAELDRVEEEISDPDKENMTPNMWKCIFMKEVGKFDQVESPSGQLGGSQTKEDAFNSLDGEHQTPVEKNLVHTLLSESILSQDEQVSNSNSCMGSTTMKTSFSPKIFLEEDVPNSPSEENQTPKSSPRSVIPEVNERARSRFQSSQVESESISELSTVKSNMEMRHTVSATGAKVSSGKKPWIMVADTSSFLDKESQKSLQLLQGLQGTQLVIPRIVMRELDSLKSKSSLFRRKTEAASVLEWIEETMVLESKWWIHIQSSAEEEERSTASTGEDHVLDYALILGRTNTNAHTVLLTNDISLKMKAMAEGLLCETPQEFRSSLVNPFSHRFMWAGSSPRGRTWSGLDDVVLKERYYGHQASAKGLKLILPYSAKSCY